ncbi:MAG TPA: GMC family oxidoreductase [Candidatus Dormibacteraeota bacterium]|nr:GMC family oxidoreductase [Candidatus Dormibacteraeota bacterium]
MGNWFHNVASAFAYSVAEEHANPDWAASVPPYNDLTRFILSQHAQMPDYLRKPMALATSGFDLFGLVAGGHLFHGKPPEVRAKQIASWKNSRIAFQRDLVRYFESLAALGLYSREVEASAPDPLFGNERKGVVGSEQRERKCDVVIVGSGPGGATTGCLLAEAGRDVLMIEEGPYYELESCIPFSRQEMLQKYRHGGQTVALGKDKVAYVEGRCVGGGSEINSGLYHRTPPDILERWRKEFQVEAVNDSELLPYFEASERELTVSLIPGAAPPAALKLHDGATKLGWKSLEVPRWFSYKPGTTQGTRQSMTKTCVPRFLKAGGKLLPDTKIRRIRQDGAKWLLEGKRADGAIRIEAQTIFIAGGAVQTPALLRRSGITRNIGDSLRLHPTVKITAQFPETINAPEMGVPTHQVKEFSPRLSFGCSISSPGYLALGMIDHPQAAKNIHRLWPYMANYYAMATGAGTGTVRLVPGFGSPLVRYALPLDARRDLADGVRKLSEMLFETGAVGLFPCVTGMTSLRSRDDLRRLPEILPAGMGNLMTIHLFSSCPMGEVKSRCATDSFGRVHGVKNLRIADASLLCTAPGVNPQGSVMAFARRNAAQFLNEKK